jgi:polar amino acid transport system substrate-binding protein
MRRFSASPQQPARQRGPAAFLLAGCLTFLVASAPRAAATDDHQQAVTALTDIKAAITELVHADASFAVGPQVYHRAAQRAINALVGDAGDGYRADAGSPGDPSGALGHIEKLLDRSVTPVWVTPLHSAEANVRAAVTYLHDALGADGFIEYATTTSRALTYLEVARGRPTETGAFGGLEGALANTVLGVPAGAQQQDACRGPSAAPAYGLHGGYVAWVAVPASDGTYALAEDPGATSLSVQGGMIVLHTVVAPIVARDCGKPNAGGPPSAAAPLPVTHVALPAPPALYTKAQAEQGKQIFTTKCVACHGADLQGTAGPSVAGNDFLGTAQRNGWTLSIIRYIVFELMPRNSPASLSPKDDASVMAYLLASDCYPPGSTPFPASDQPTFATIKLGPVPGKHSGENAKGVCPLD